MVLKVFYTRYLIVFNGVFKDSSGSTFIGSYIKDTKNKVTYDVLQKWTNDIKNTYKDTFSECFIVSYQKVKYELSDIK